MCMKKKCFWQLTLNINISIIRSLQNHLFYFILHFFPLSPTRSLPFLNLTDNTGSNGFTRGLPKSYCPPKHGYNADTDMLGFLLLLLLYNGVNRYDITEILLKVAFNTITLPPIMVLWLNSCNRFGIEFSLFTQKIELLLFSTYILKKYLKR